ncbi:MAG: beta-lactamase family protein [Steroidobacteraceae bacterium]|jgi:CubicO group peptidase (beta-lactamase class C family)|nr:beta-lactamase family protein [Steroidobacteraceae bacterium]
MNRAAATLAAGLLLGLVAPGVVPAAAPLATPAQPVPPMPPGVADPTQAITDPVYRDPVFWWRMSSLPKDVYEPDAYFYWPPAVVEGAPGPWLPLAAPGRTSLPAAGLEAAAAWAEARKTNALIIIHDGKVQLERYWNGMTPGELANGRALTRSITPMVLGFAVADGRLALEDPIGRYVTEWKDDPRGAITVRQLAQNVSGLEVAPSLPVTVVQGNKDLCLAYCGDVVRAALDYERASAPGTRFEVAQENTQLLALVIERAMGQPIQSILSERVWKPIGAANAAFQMDRPGGVARVMCCMRATPRDWARVGWLLAQDGRWNGRQVLPAGWAKTMGTPSARNPNFGLGLWLGSPYVAKRAYFEGQPGVIPQSEPFLADDVRIMEGGGFRTIFIVPSRKLVILRHGQQVADWDNAALVNAVLRR